LGALDGKVCLITGAGSGIGRAGARMMAGEGAAVVVADINEAAGRGVAGEITAAGGRALFHPVDVRSSQSVQALVGGAVAAFGRLDVLFHNAVDVALVNRQDRRATELPEETWDALIALVLTGTFLCAKYAGRQMLAQRSGSIILTATVDALIGQAGIDGYTAAKGGVVALTRSLAAGLSPEGVRVNAICPGFVETPGQAAFLSVPEERAKVKALHLMDILQPEDVAAFAVFLASDRARLMTGGIHPVDAGYSAFKGTLGLKETFELP
jgi:NAD(P)-dependent dehydrogenase (short-subunit alcohol dehydrogenase family)